jgi:hypothetical protein
MAADEMPVDPDPAGDLGKCLGPAALDEERRPDVGGGKGVEQSVGVTVGGWSIGMLGVEREGDFHGRYFSTPVMTMPRVNTRWKITKRMTGMSRVIIVPAWMNAGFW